MCGIIGYVGNKNASDIIFNGLKRMEYRGYDSAGVAFMNGQLLLLKEKGKIDDLLKNINQRDLDGYNAGIGHTRWATHGGPSKKNAHPHTSCHKEIAVVHNGIIENYKAIKQMLEGHGHKIKSDTDSEVIPHLIEYYYVNRKKTLLESVMKTLSQLEGTYGLLVMSKDEPEKIIAAKKGSPLILGLVDDGMIVASDASAIIEHTRRVIYLEDNEVVEVMRESFKTYNLERQLIDKTIEDIDWEIGAIEKKGFAYFMLKEIYEQPETIHNAFRGRILSGSGNVRLDGLRLTNDELANIKRVIFIACGTSWHAGLVGEYLIEEYARIPVEVEYASEFRYRKPILRDGDIVFVISQSGETADTLAALREAKARGVKVLGLTNVVGSSIARETDGGIYIHAGPEIGVASTKAFTSQLTVIILLTILLARKRNMTSGEAEVYLNFLKKIPEDVAKIFERDKQIQEIAYKYKDNRNFLYLGRGVHFPVALEGALKLKEISYIHAEGYPAAEMKHGPIALIDENMPIIFIATRDEVYKKVLSNMEEVKARQGNIIAVAFEDDKEIGEYANHVITIPPVRKLISPLLTIIPLQLLAYHIAVMRGCNVDEPRNLAKSVTVE